MPSKRAVLRAAVLLAALTAFALSNIAPAHAQPAQRRVTIIAIPEEAARQLLSSIGPGGLGLGVYPASRDATRFVLEIGRASPTTDPQAVPLGLTSALRRAGVVTISGSLNGPFGETLFSVFEPVPRGSKVTGATAVIEVLSPASDEVVDFVVRDRTAIVLGIGERTPVLVGVLRGGANGILSGGISHRPGLLTPYDLGVTILKAAGVTPTDDFVGHALTIERESGPMERIDALSRRLERDDSFAPGLAAVAVGSGGLLVIFAWFLSRLRRTALALRLAQAAVFVLPGWVLAEFIPSSAWGVRALPIFAGVVLGAVMEPWDPLRTFARVGFGSAFAFAVLVAIAPLNPGGEPGLSMWGNPLVSWRFFGVQNVQAAIIASGIVVWGVLAGLAAPMLAVVALAAAIVTGAPAIGANFVAVLTFVFGAVVAITALVRRHASVRQLLASGAVAVGAFVLALLADSGSPVSHGGRAARRISSDGLSAAWDLIEGRLRLNLELIGDFSGGWVFVSLLLVTLAALIAWGLRIERGPLRARVAVLAGALMALASMVLEDSGFYSGAVLWFVAADAWLLVTLAPGSLGVSPPESDAPLAGVGTGTKPPQPGAARRSRSWRG